MDESSWIGRRLEVVFGYDYEDQLTIDAPIQATIVEAGRLVGGSLRFRATLSKPIEWRGKQWSEFVVESRHEEFPLESLLQGKTIAVATTAVRDHGFRSDGLEVSWWRGQTPGKIASARLLA